MEGYCPHTPGTHLCLKPAQTKQTDQQNTPAFNHNIAGGLVKGRGVSPLKHPGTYLFLTQPSTAAGIFESQGPLEDISVPPERSVASRSSRFIKDLPSSQSLSEVN